MMTFLTFPGNIIVLDDVAVLIVITKEGIRVINIKGSLVRDIRMIVVPLVVLILLGPRIL